MGKKQRKKTIYILIIGGVFVIAFVGFAAIGWNFDRVTHRAHNEWAAQGFSTVSGRVHNSKGRPVRMRRTNIQLCGQACFAAETTLQGNFAFTRIPPGEYRIYAVHNECQSAEQDVFLGQQGQFKVIAEPLVTNHC